MLQWLNTFILLPKFNPVLGPAWGNFHIKKVTTDGTWKWTTFIWDELHNWYIYWCYQCWIILHWLNRWWKVLELFKLKKILKWKYDGQKFKEYKLLQIKLNQLVLKHHLHVVFLLISKELQSKLFVKNFDKVRIAKQIVYKKLYQHKYYLPEEEQLNRLSRLIVE